MRASAGERLALIASSYAAFFGRPLVKESPGTLEWAMWVAPRAIVAHGTELQPRFFYGNRVALELFEMRSAVFVGLPSYESAEPAEREAREHMLEGLRLRGFVADYAGVRIGAAGRRFAISGAHVWNLVDASGKHHGQAATFAEWRFLD